MPDIIKRIHKASRAFASVLVPKIFVFVFVFVISSCSMSDEDGAPDNKINAGDPLPAFTVVMNDGSLLSTSDLRGKPSLIVFFNTTCKDCQRELPGINRRYLAHGKDTTFVAIAREQSAADIAAYWSQQGFSLPYSPQDTRYIYSLFATQGIPRIYISDAQGIVRRVQEGY